MREVPAEATFSGPAYVHGDACGEIISSYVELSFWGGVNPTSGVIIDRDHPLSGRLLTGKILAVPGGRGSCSGSGVILELLLNGKGPAAMLIAREDDILTLGAVIAEEVFGKFIPVVMLAPDDFRQVTSAQYAHVRGSRVECGWQTVGTTLTALRSVTHALRGWPTPVGAGLNTADPAFDPLMALSEDRMHWQLEEVGRQVVEFAETRILLAETSQPGAHS